MKYLGIDYGSKRVGIAVSDENGKVAFPLETLQNSNDLIKKVKETAKEKGAATIVLGESKNFAGEPNTIMKKILEFKTQLAKETGLKVLFEPEFMTSSQARRIQGDVEKLDASAAAIILQSFLDKTENSKTNTN